MIEFINHKTLFPLRIEFHDYFEWAAKRVDHLVSYGSEVIAIEPVEIDGEVAWFEVVSREGDQPELVVRRARNVVVATGLEPHLPSGLPRSERIWHNSELVPRVEQMRGTPVRRAVVVGAGQSAAESVAHLHRSLPEAEVCAVFGKYGYTPADDSPYANRIFDPQAVDVFFGAPPEVKQSLLDYHRSTNYSVVDLDLIEELYRQEYQELVQGRQRLRILNASAIRHVAVRADDLSVVIESLPTGDVTTWDVDLLVYATGYRPSDPGVLLGAAGRLAVRDDAGRLRVGRDYRVGFGPSVSAGVYLQGATEYAHGISATLLSNTAVRAGEILESVLDHSTVSAQHSLALAGDPQ
jgi:L-ornithine N5-oxygenase